MIRRCPSCDRPGVRSGHLMCGPCWRSVPAGLRHAVNRTWRGCKDAFIDSPKWKLYYVARKAAIAAAVTSLVRAWRRGSGGGALNAA